MIEKQITTKAGYHPEFIYWLSELEKIEDCFAGQKAVKGRQCVYLPKPKAMTNNLLYGNKLYSDYLLRANYRNFPKQIAGEIFGILNQNKAVFEVEKGSEAFKSFTENLDGQGRTVQDIIEDINKEQLSFSRVGYLVNPSNDVKLEPHIIKYEAEKIINWGSHRGDDGQDVLDFVILDESKLEADSKGLWSIKETYRVLRMYDGYFEYYFINNLADINLDSPVKYYNEGEEFKTLQAIIPTIAGKKIERIPFVIVNWDCVSYKMTSPFILPICDLSLSIYRKDADYHQYLFNSAQDTFWSSGADPEEVNTFEFGAGGAIVSNNSEFKCGFIGISGDGINSIKEAINDNIIEVNNLGITLSESSNESGKALSIRMTAKTSALSKMSKSATDGIFDILKLVAEWLGEEIEFILEPNLDFSSEQILSQELVQLQSAKNMGFPLSQSSLHAWAKGKGYTELTYEEELGELETEDPFGNMSINQPNNQEPV